MFWAATVRLSIFCGLRGIIFSDPDTWGKKKQLLKNTMGNKDGAMPMKQSAQLKAGAVLSWLAVILAMGIIFMLSAQPAVLSDQLSRGITFVLVQAAEKLLPGKEWHVIIFDELVRKTAHFICYLVLGVVVANTLRVVGLGKAKASSLALLICLLFAISDEIHQIYVPGRGAQIQDFLADGAGTLLGISLYLLGAQIYAGRHQQSKH